MKMMRAYGGQAIAVYQAVNRPGVEQLLRQRRVDFIYPADYREGTGLDTTVKDIIRKIAVADRLWGGEPPAAEAFGGRMSFPTRWSCFESPPARGDFFSALAGGGFGSCRIGFLLFLLPLTWRWIVGLVSFSGGLGGGKEPYGQEERPA